MSKKIDTFETSKEFSSNPFIGYYSDKTFDASFIVALSKPAKQIIKYLIYKQGSEKKKLLLDINEFYKFIGHRNVSNLSKGLIELCSKELLAKTSCVDVYWVNNNFLNTGVFQPH